MWCVVVCCGVMWCVVVCCGVLRCGVTAHIHTHTHSQEPRARCVKSYDVVAIAEPQTVDVCALAAHSTGVAHVCPSAIARPITISFRVQIHAVAPHGA